MMKQVKIKILDDVCRDPSDNFIINTLKKKYQVVISENPDYVFYSVKSKDIYKYNCIRIYYTDENLVPDFNICDYAIGFHYIDFQDRYIRFPVYMLGDYVYYAGDNYGLDLERAMHKHENTEDCVRKKTQFCSFVYSNSEAAKCRKKIFDAISSYKTVNSGGSYKNNVGGAISNKLDFQTKHKFVIAFENSAGYGYTTEKIVHAFSAGAIPIYWGNPAIEREFNVNSFINCNDYGLTEDGDEMAVDRIVSEIVRLDNDDSAYLKMLKTPAFIKDNYVEELRCNFEAFLYNIFDQPLENAYRRNRLYWGKRYERKQRIGESFYQFCRKAIPVRDALTSFIKR